MKYATIAMFWYLGFAFLAPQTFAADLLIHLSGSGPLTHTVVQFSCGPGATKMGLPAEPFSVEYINGAGNSLAILPINGTSLIFVSVQTGSGARYAANQYTWIDAGSRGVSLSSGSIAGEAHAACSRVNARNVP